MARCCWRSEPELSERGLGHSTRCEAATGERCLSVPHAGTIIRVCCDMSPCSDNFLRFLLQNLVLAILEAHPHSPTLETVTLLFKCESICLGLNLGGELGAGGNGDEHGSIHPALQWKRGLWRRAYE